MDVMSYLQIRMIGFGSVHVARVRTPSYHNVCLYFCLFTDRETQIVLEEDLGLSPHVLGRGIFQGQHHLNGLLESTDAQLKEDLALLVRIVRICCTLLYC